MKKRKHNFKATNIPELLGKGKHVEFTTTQKKFNPIVHIELYMNKNGLLLKDFAELCEINRSQLSQCLSFQRRLSLNMIRKIHKHTNIPLEELIKEY